MGCDIHMRVERRTDSGTWEKLTLPEDLDARDYNFFAILANVRNGTWGDELPPISGPRGLPADFQYDDPDSEWLGDHSFSWVTLRELLDYDWGYRVQMRAYIARDLAATWDGVSRPKSYAAWSSNGVPVFWTQTARDSVRVMDKLLALAECGDPERIRLVFGFDS